MTPTPATEVLLPRGKDDLDYDRGFLDGWEHAMSVLQFERGFTLSDTAGVRYKRRKVNACGQ